MHRKTDFPIVVQIPILILIFVVYFVFPERSIEGAADSIRTETAMNEELVESRNEQAPKHVEMLTSQSMKDVQVLYPLLQDADPTAPSPDPLLNLPAYTPAKVDYTQQKVHYRNKAAVLCYHHFDDKETGVTISTQRFHNHLQMLAANGYNIISMEQFVQFMKYKQPVPQNAVLITFDDGYESVYAKAFPELKKFNVVGTTFLVGDSIDHPPPKSAPRLNWDEIREMRRAGNEFFSHTYNMHEVGKTDAVHNLNPILANPLYLENEHRAETQDEYRMRVKNDLLRMEQRLTEELGPVRHLLAFPYGAYNQTVLQVSREAGFELFFTTSEGINAPGMDEIYRINAGAKWMTPELLLTKLRKYDENNPGTR